MTCSPDRLSRCGFGAIVPRGWCLLGLTDILWQRSCTLTAEDGVNGRQINHHVQREWVLSLLIWVIWRMCRRVLEEGELGWDTWPHLGLPSLLVYACLSFHFCPSAPSSYGLLFLLFLNTERRGKMKFLHVWISKIFCLGNKPVMFSQYH